MECCQESIDVLGFFQSLSDFNSESAHRLESFLSGASRRLFGYRNKHEKLTQSLLGAAGFVDVGSAFFGGAASVFFGGAASVLGSAFGCSFGVSGFFSSTFFSAGFSAF